MKHLTFNELCAIYSIVSRFTEYDNHLLSEERVTSIQSKIEDYLNEWQNEVKELIAKGVQH